MDEFVKARPFVERTARGRPFAKGNPGRKPGSKNKTTLIGQALLKEAEEQLLRKAIEMAKAGDGPMLKFLLDRILPKERCIELPAPDHDCDPVERCEAIVDAVSAGRITPNEAASLVTVAGGHARIIDLSEVDERLEAIEKQLQTLKAN
jgi:hypothetical protein